VFPERLGRRHAARLTIVPAPLPLPGFTMVAAWHERVHQAPAHQWLREAVVRALAAG
jgi:DNA-binding transcriptional LysR family regulator